MTSPSKRLFVGSLPYKFNEGELLTLFAPFGRIISMRIMHNQWGKSRGLGFVEFDALESAVKAKEAMHNYQLEERSIIVDYSKPDPFLTEEGKARHLQALSKKKFRHPQKTFTPSSSTNSRPDSRAKRPFSPKITADRQTVYDQRAHHSKVGAKFAKRNRNK
ncbi:MAG TPA: RNA-binding protein [Candidatus Woesebacteria bacterium]|nr:RNA-binding protein [Candidatus Woesebacteria bacterium]HPJ16897.1 RNA-binding protein [Candidatus Woesebacteria bacterium]